MESLPRPLRALDRDPDRRTYGSLQLHERAGELNYEEGATHEDRVANRVKRILEHAGTNLSTAALAAARTQDRAAVRYDLVFENLSFYFTEEALRGVWRNVVNVCHPDRWVHEHQDIRLGLTNAFGILAELNRSAGVSSRLKNRNSGVISREVEVENAALAYMTKLGPPLNTGALLLCSRDADSRAYAATPGLIPTLVDPRTTFDFVSALHLQTLDLPAFMREMALTVTFGLPAQSLGETWRTWFRQQLELMDRAFQDWRIVMLQEAPESPVEAVTARLLGYSWLFEPAFVNFLHHEVWLDADFRITISRGSSPTEATRKLTLYYLGPAARKPPPDEANYLYVFNPMTTAAPAAGLDLESLVIDFPHVHLEHVKKILEDYFRERSTLGHFDPRSTKWFVSPASEYGDSEKAKDGRRSQ